MDIKDYFNFYAINKTDKSQVKKFSFLNKQATLVKYLKTNKNEIIKQINYAFFESKEPYLLSVFSAEVANYIHINSRLCREFPKNFDSLHEFENYLAIYGTFAVLIGESFQISSLNDSKIYYRDFLEDLTFKIFYDDVFRLNLESLLIDKNNILRFVYRYGYDFLLQSFKIFYKDEFSYSTIKRFLNISDEEFNELYGLYRNKIILESNS